MQPAAKTACEPLRILILSTPKTGNTWLSRLLSAIYDLPQLGLVAPFNVKQARELGPRWVLFHHHRPSPEFVSWIEESRPILLTTVRHPADVLVSLYYHLREFEPGAIDAAAVHAMLSRAFDRSDILCDATGSFQDDLECSLAWLRSGRVGMVRYEDLWRDAYAELQRLTSQICPVPERRIALAVERSDFGLMRRLARSHGKFFRSGTVGGWREVLPQQVLDDLGREPYASLIAELGYAMDPRDPIIDAPRVPRQSINPFKQSGRNPAEALALTEEEARFDNGVPVAPLLVDIYLALCETSAWEGDPSATGPGSYYAWLNQPFEAPREGYGQVLITNLAEQLRLIRPDLNQAFVDLQGAARADYADWFVRGGATRMELDACFIEPMRQSLVAWATARSPQDREAWAWWPKLPNFAMHLYAQTEELRAAYPDILCFDRWSYLEWIVAHAEEANINPDFVEPVKASLKKLAKLRSVGRYLPGARVRIAQASTPN